MGTAPTAVVKVMSTPAIATMHTNSLGQRYMMLTSVDVEGAAATDTPPERRVYSVKKCCCGMSLAMGVWLIALIEVFGSIGSIVSSMFLFYLKSNENKIDHAIMKQDGDENQAEIDGSDSSSNGGEDVTGPPPMTPEEQVDATNTAIDMGFYMAPIILVVSLVSLYFSCSGLKASRGDASAARRYTTWKRFLVIYAFISILFSFGSPGSMFSLFFAMYFFIVVRSHAIELTRIELEQTAAQSSV